MRWRTQPYEYVSTSTKDLPRKIRKLEQESNLHPPITDQIFYLLNYPIFSPSSPQAAKEKKITQSHCCYLLQLNSQNRRKLFFYGEFLRATTHFSCIWALKSLAINHSLAIGIWHGAGATKSWFSVLSIFCSWLISVNFLFILSLGRCFVNWRIPPRNGHLFWKIELNHPSFNEKWLELAVTSPQLLRLFDALSIHLFISVYLSVQDTTSEGVPSSCGCSLALTVITLIGIWHSADVTKGVTSPAAHRGIWHGAGATKSWFLVLSLSCFCRISLCIRSNYDSGGWATRTIYFSLKVFSTVSISLIR